MPQIQCPKCGAILPPNTSVCPTCGTQFANVAQSYNNGQPYQQPQQPQQPQYQQPQQQQYQQPQQPYYQPQSSGSGSKIIIGVLAALLILLAGGAVFYFMTQNQKNKEEVAELKEQIEKEKVSEEPKVAEPQAPSEVIVKEGAVNADAHHSVSSSSRNATTQGDGGPVKVVINGTGVRLRFAPSLNAGWLTWPNGQTRTVSKGTRLTYLGEDGDWYTVSYMGETFYVSKEYSYKVIPN